MKKFQGAVSENRDFMENRRGSEAKGLQASRARGKGKGAKMAKRGKKELRIEEGGFVVLVEGKGGYACALCGSEKEGEDRILELEAWSGTRAAGMGDLIRILEDGKGRALQAKLFAAAEGWGGGAPEGWIWIEGAASRIHEAAELARRVLSERAGLGAAAALASPRKRGPGL